MSTSGSCPGCGTEDLSSRSSWRSECSQRGKPQPKSVPRIARMGHSRNSRQKNLRKNPRNPRLVVQNGQISRSPSKRGLKPATTSSVRRFGTLVVAGFSPRSGSGHSPRYEARSLVLSGTCYGLPLCVSMLPASYSARISISPAHFREPQPKT